MKIQSAIQEKIESTFPVDHLEIENESHQHSAGRAESHFKLLLVSSQFEGLGKVQRQQKIYQLLAHELQSGVHALTMRLLTPQEWSQGAGSGFQSPTCHSKKSKNL